MHDKIDETDKIKMIPPIIYIVISILFLFGFIFYFGFHVFHQSEDIVLEKSSRIYEIEENIPQPIHETIYTESEIATQSFSVDFYDTDSDKVKYFKIDGINCIIYKNRFMSCVR